VLSLNSDSTLFPQAICCFQSPHLAFSILFLKANIILISGKCKRGGAKGGRCFTKI